MLHIITAAETLFRHESESRQRDDAILASIRERHAATMSAEGTESAAKRVAPRPAWARPIAVRIATPRFEPCPA